MLAPRPGGESSILDTLVGEGRPDQTHRQTGRKTRAIDPASSAVISSGVPSGHHTGLALRVSSAVARALVLAVLVAIPLRIVASGYLPIDDAQRHAAKAVSGKAWNEILVQRDDITVDQHPGWHALLRGVHLATGASTYDLTVFAVVFLFVVVAWTAAILLRRPEAWLLALFVLAVIDPVALRRFLAGRPLLLDAAVLVAVLLRWDGLRRADPPRGLMAWLTVLFALAASCHAGWYLFLLPLGCFLLAGEVRVALRLGACWLAGTLVGATFTLHPFTYLALGVQHLLLAFGTLDADVRVAEFQGYYESPLVAAALALVLLWRSQRGTLDRSLLRDPVFLLAVLGWLGGFVSMRLWLDWGAPAFLVWLARDFEAALERGSLPSGSDRLVAVTAASLAAFLATSSNVGDRWGPPYRDSPGLQVPLSARSAGDAPWVPDTGGILYAVDMRIFYRTFFANPQAPWRYVLGYEPGLMRSEDLAVYAALARNPLDLSPLSRWVAKMTAADRLLLFFPAAQPPPIPELQWQQVRPALWSGRRPR
jgi:hypothetical protein